MAPDEPSVPRTRRRSSRAAGSVSSATLAELIERERVQILQIHAMLKCLNDVLLYSDDDNSIMHADVANVAARLLDESAARLEVLGTQAAQLAAAVADRATALSAPEIPPDNQVRESVPRYQCSRLTVRNSTTHSPTLADSWRHVA
jgi:hypothetical protein